MTMTRGKPFPVLPALIVDDDPQVACGREPSHDVKGTACVLVRQRILEGMKHGADAAAPAFPGHFDRLFDAALPFRDAPVRDAPERYLDERERLCPDILRPYDAIT